MATILMRTKIELKCVNLKKKILWQSYLQSVSSSTGAVRFHARQWAAIVKLATLHSSSALAFGDCYYCRR